ncbi:MAG: 2-C-methyl-D-erythritol 4-phosphate cytidylyltransferase [Rhodothermia bacterium]
MADAAAEISVGVVIPAAGSGERLGGRRKQFRLLDGKPLLVLTSAIFQKHPQVSTIAVVAPGDDVRPVAELAQDFGLTKISAVVKGGATRQESVRNGLRALPRDTSLVITHDAVRPFVTADEVSRLIAETQRSGAAAIAAPVNDTLVRSKARTVGETVSRDGLFRMLTPQAFRYEILRRAHDLAAESDTPYTDEVTLVRAAGNRVTLVEGSVINIKITTESDWELAEWIWPAWKNLV